MPTGPCPKMIHASAGRDISRAHEVLAWAPRVPVKEGLARTIDYFERLLVEEGVREAIVG